MDKEFFLKRILADKKATRREFLVNATALGVSMTAASAMWSEAKAAEPKRGGVYRMAQHDGNTSDQHDPGQYQSNFEISFGHTVRAYLTMINADGSLGPDVAKEWSATPDATDRSPIRTSTSRGRRNPCPDVAQHIGSSLWPRGRSS